LVCRRITAIVRPCQCSSKAAISVSKSGHRVDVDACRIPYKTKYDRNIAMSELEESQNAAGYLAHSRVARFWLRELPYIVVLVLTILGVAYTSVSHQPLIGYWEFLAVATGLVCVSTGWLHIHDPKPRFRMVWTQALHWLAFLVAMNIVLLPDVQAMLNAPATGLTLLMLLALGTFVAGVHVSWHICALGIAMALFVPAIAWLAESALFLVLGVVALIGIGMTFWWRLSDRHTLTVPSEE
jgi:hypothetical protein